jgi:hypothetical protein
MKRIARLSVFLGLLAAIAGGALAGASTAAVTSPTGLHGFLLVTNDSPSSVFHRTPSFAWAPLGDAVRYELQLSTSETFKENGIIYDVSNLKTPVAAPALTLPWITGSPHSMYARVRAFLANGQTSPWSTDYGFDVVPPPAPTSMGAAPGLLRWTPVDGANGYQVWLKDAGKIETTDTNVLDEREIYAFHTGSAWISSVHWRVRAIRWTEIAQKNNLPVSHYGPWSTTYTASNPAPSTGQVVLGNTMSDTVSNGSPSSPAHSLAPAFTWTGNQALDGTPEPFWRVEVFTDSQCLNRVFTGSVVGTQAYAPRLFGGLAMPMTPDAFTAASSEYLQDVDAESNPTSDASAADGPLIPNENLPHATPTLSAGKGSAQLKIQDPQDIGAPVDVWDVKWPSSGYYWTVVPVELSEWADGSYHWQDVEVPQDVCAAGRVARFGFSSQPSVTSHGAPYATGLSASGKLVSGSTNPFYGQPLVSWTPVPDADSYEIQWGKKAYPFVARGKTLTWDTSFVLPLKPGTWYYRVRGYNYHLPTGAQEMAWSNPVKIVVAAPSFRVK